MNRLMLSLLWLLGGAGVSWAASASQPVEEIDGMAVVEAEHFYAQSQTQKHSWLVTAANSEPNVQPDIDPAHLAGASGGAYVEVLPDMRQNGKPIPPDKAGLSDTPGAEAVLLYRVRFNRPGRYYIWARSYGSDGDDNTVHFGLDGEWPASSARFHGRAARQWTWECRHRMTREKIYFDIDKPGDHIVSLSMREDGFELDKFILTDNALFLPPGYVPVPTSAPTSRVAQEGKDQGVAK